MTAFRRAWRYEHDTDQGRLRGAACGVYSSIMLLHHDAGIHPMNHHILAQPQRPL